MTFHHARSFLVAVGWGGISAVSACTIPKDTSTYIREDATVAAARHALVGLSDADVRMCAGFPTSTADVGEAVQIWTYERQVQRGTVNVFAPAFGIGPTIPALGGSLNVGSRGYCHAQMQFVNGHVVKVAYAGDNNQTGSLNALCSTFVDGCVVYARDLDRGVQEKQK